MTRPRSILFLTTLSLSSNPRLVKELELACCAGFDVTVVFFRIGNWGDANDLRWMRDHPSVRCIRLSALRRPFLMWFLGSVLEKAARLFIRFVDVPIANAMASGKRYLLLRRAVGRLGGRYDWVVAHNPSAFHPALLASERLGAHLGIDIEDYHPAETPNPHLAAALRSLMRTCLSRAYYTSYASPLIREASDAETGLPMQEGIVVLNSFPRIEFPLPGQAPAGPLRLVWFSQHVNAGRGLEIVLPALSEHAGAVELHLYGVPDPSFRRGHLDGIPNVVIHGPLPQAQLHAALSSHDVGLAVDVLSDANRDLAVTNKIIAYLQSGLFLAVTETRAQRRLISDFPGHGLLFSPDSETFAKVLASLVADIERIRMERKRRYEAASVLDWDVESRGLLRIWEKAPV